ncbi:UPF0481 protein At3g47200 [Populus alba]|nr:putative UPF0481 protein At3g02645 [Populus alba]
MDATQRPQDVITVDVHAAKGLIASGHCYLDVRLEKGEFIASASNMESDIEQGRALNMEEDKPSSPNKGKDIDVGSASENMMTGELFAQLDSKVKGLPSQHDYFECCIYRVSKRVQSVQWQAYSPLLISIGPLHRDDKKRQVMENEKLRYYRTFIERVGMDKEKIRDIMSSIQNQEERLRNCYSEEFKLTRKSDFIEMVMLDAVFIIEFMKEYSNNDEGPNRFQPKTILDIREDLILLENQLPFFIIQKIYDEYNRARQDPTAIPFFDLVTSHSKNYTFLKNVETNRSVKNSRHFTDLLRNFMLNGARQPNAVTLRHSAVKLRAAGVVFEVAEDKCLLNITFEKGVLKIPLLEVDYHFERAVRNIIALEQCLYQNEAYVCSYIQFMDHLIDSPEDVGLLVGKGIITHWLGNDAAVSDMINKLCENISDPYTYYDDMCTKMNARRVSFAKILVNHIFETLKLLYCADIWRAKATVGASILLILTLIQTINSFL